MLAKLSDALLEAALAAGAPVGSAAGNPRKKKEKRDPDAPKRPNTACELLGVGECTLCVML